MTYILPAHSDELTPEILNLLVTLLALGNLDMSTISDSVRYCYFEKTVALTDWNCGELLK